MAIKLIGINPLNKLPLECNLGTRKIYFYLNKAMKFGSLTVTFTNQKIIRNAAVANSVYADLLFRVNKGEDVIFIAKDGSNFSIKKNILMARSEVFTAMLNKEMKEGNTNTIKMNIEPELRAFTSFLKKLKNLELDKMHMIWPF